MYHSVLLPPLLKQGPICSRWAGKYIIVVKDDLELFVCLCLLLLRQCLTE